MLYIAICDDDEGVCAELERMLYDYAEQNKIQIDIDIWYTACIGKIFCQRREPVQISERERADSGCVVSGYRITDNKWN